MSQVTALDALRKVADIAVLAGLNGKLDDKNEIFGAIFELPGGRTQGVYVKYSGEVKEQPVVKVYSPAVHIKKGMLGGGLSKAQAVALLKANEQTAFARYSVADVDGGELVLASVDSLLDTLDTEELEAHMWCVAFAADNYEQKHGQDTF